MVRKMIKDEILTLNNINYIDEILDILDNWQNINKTQIKKEIIKGITENKMPITILLTNEKELIGFYQIVEHDNDNTIYTPWIANLIIKEQYRNKGYGKILINTITKYMKKYNISKIYLHSRHKNFYEKFGFKIYKKLNLNDNIERNIYLLEKNTQ